MKKRIWLFSILSIVQLTIHAQQIISANAGAGYTALYTPAQTTLLYTDEHDDWLVQKAAALLQQDIKMVTGKEPEIVHSLPASANNLIIIGSLDNCDALQQLITAGKFNTATIRDKWEAYQVQTIAQPFGNISNALVIAGSDKRGAAYGVFELSKQLGVSPWYWWADVPAKKAAGIFVKQNTAFHSEPGVQYRGIFLNDEAPALSGWTKEKFGGFNHLFYEKVFELILRLKGNYLWPAMWGNAFNDDDTLNPQLADMWGIVMGTSHHEPMLRAQQEWKRYGSGAWNYETNSNTLQSFWKKGIQNMGNHESIVTIGMRGDGDMPMNEGSNIALLERIVTDQRSIIQQVTGKPAAATPQLWALYKEVQDYYDKGMRVPDDVTLLLCDDNWGNIRKLPKLTDRPRTGGYGIYYHFDYVGGPRNYKWLNTNSIARTWEQMHLAYEYNVRKIWIVNVGDLKPMELPISFFLDYAWAPQQWNENNLQQYTSQWAAQQFGQSLSKSIANILDKYTQFNARRKPELLAPETYSLSNYREAERVTREYRQLANQAEAIYKTLPAAYKDAYEQLVLFPVQACANLNELYVVTAKNRLYAQQGRAITNILADSVKTLFLKDSLLSYHYNNVMANGKWSHMMDQTHIGYTYWQQPLRNSEPATSRIAIPATPAMGISIEGAGTNAQMPELNALVPQKGIIEIFNRGTIAFKYTATSSQSWLELSPKQGNVQLQQEISVTVNWAKAPVGKHIVPITIKGTDSTATVYAVVNKPAYYRSVKPNEFIQTDNYISIEAEHYNRAAKAGNTQWKVIPQLSRTLSGMTIFPVTSAAQTPGSSAAMEYDIYTNDSGNVQLQVTCAPTLNFHNTQGLQYAISIDNAIPQIINLHPDQSNKTWEQWVANNCIVTTSQHTISKAGKHTIRIRAVDAAVVVQKITASFGTLPASYLGPQETRYQLNR
ncbi:MAG: glycosyl hydrolase 115 family protein [Chitinophagaceae bacterium]